MRSLSAQNILYIWEIGQAQHPIDRALTLLQVACPEKSMSELIALSIGQRDSYLLTLREQTFGSQLDGAAECPQCHERLEFELPMANIRFPAPEPAEQTDHLCHAAGFELQFRLPNSQDLAAIVPYQDVAAARDLLIQRCLLKASRDGTAVAYPDLPDEVLTQLVEQVVASDPQAEVVLPLTCAACGYTWSTLFDIIDFFWTELTVLAQRLLLEVHLLAKAYSWRETDILSMSAVRRQYYLDLMG